VLRAKVVAWCTNQTAAASEYGDISGWDVSQVTDMAGLFSPLDEPLEGDYGSYYYEDYAGEAPAPPGVLTTCNPNIGPWGVSSVVNMERMFYGAEAFNQELGGWNVSSVLNMEGMFSYAEAFNQELGGWDVSSVVNMKGMFSFAYDFNQELSGWDVSSVVNMERMFYWARAFNQELGGWDVSSVVNMTRMFSLSREMPGRSSGDAGEMHTPVRAPSLGRSKASRSPRRVRGHCRPWRCTARGCNRAHSGRKGSCQRCPPSLAGCTCNMRKPRCRETGSSAGCLGQPGHTLALRVSLLTLTRTKVSARTRRCRPRRLSCRRGHKTPPPPG
jgi:hypothetical protein